MILNWLISIFVFIFGVCIGSFLNCVIYRTELQEEMPKDSPNRKAVSFLHGNSFCPDCKHQLSWKDLFPVFSFIFLGGKCRYCHKKISIQYPLVEILTGILFLLLFNQQNILQSVFYFIICAFLIIIFVYDLKHYIIPDKVLFPAIALTIIYNLIPPYNWQNIFYNVLAAVIAAGFFLIIFLATKGRGMGFGDVKLAILMGLLLGLPNTFVALFLAFLFGAIIGLALMILPFGSTQGRKRMSLKSEIPFGPFLILGTFIAVLWGSQIVNWYLGFFVI